MDTTTLLKGIKKIVREVVKQELTDILREGLQETINEMAKAQLMGTQHVMTENVVKRPSISNIPAPVAPTAAPQGNGMFKNSAGNNPYAKILNNTSPHEVDAAQAASIMDFISEGQGGPRVVMDNGTGAQPAPQVNEMVDSNMKTAEQLIAEDPQLAMQFAGGPGAPVPVPEPIQQGPNNGPDAAMNNIAKSLKKDYRALMKTVDKKVKSKRPG